MKKICFIKELNPLSKNDLDFRVPDFRKDIINNIGKSVYFEPQNTTVLVSAPFFTGVGTKGTWSITRQTFNLYFTEEKPKLLDDKLFEL